MIDYAKELNAAQYEAATTLDGPVLVIAGAGTGKTRTIVYRLARLVESGVPAASILLLTFTRKAAREMTYRAGLLLGREADHSQGLDAIQGGTFHAYAYSVLRMFKPVGFEREATVMDTADSLAALQHCKEELKLPRGDHSFPKTQTILGLISKCRNKEMTVEETLSRDAQHLLPHARHIERIAEAYAALKKEQSLLDYDDLLFRLEESLRERPEVLRFCRSRHSHIMVDEYQDTNLVQARIAALLAGTDNDAACSLGGCGNIMAVGDDAQSIYAFRGATVRNILEFPKIFPGARIIRLEENYRSVQPVLDLANNILIHAPEGYGKTLFTAREGGEKPLVIRPLSDLTQASVVSGRVMELLRSFPPQEIAVLFRAGYQSYHVEMQLAKNALPFRKFGGIRYSEAAHVKDIMAYLRLVLNPLDFPAFQRMAMMSRGIGPKTVVKLYRDIQRGDTAALDKARKKYPVFGEDMAFLDTLRTLEAEPRLLYGEALAHYEPRLAEQYPDDYPRRKQGLDQLGLIAALYTDLDLLVADLALEEPLQEEEERSGITLSTIHSAKGLEWGAVILLDLVEDRFPSRHAMTRPDDFEEERRLMYVACTRAKDRLEMCAPATLYDRGMGCTSPSKPSPFLCEMPPTLYEEWREGYNGKLTKREVAYQLPNGFGNRGWPGTTAPEATARPEGRSRSPFALPDWETDPDPAMAEMPPEAYARAAAERNGAPAARPGHQEEEPEETCSSLGAPTAAPESLGYCTHRIFGRGKIIQKLPPDKYRVNFPGVGLKVIMGAYLVREE